MSSADGWARSAERQKTKEKTREARLRRSAGKREDGLVGMKEKETTQEKGEK